jgi:hypothetical protein
MRAAVMLDKLGERIQTMHLTKVNSEILVGDRLIKRPRDQFVSYVPHSPDANIQGRSSRFMTVWTARPSTPTW